MTDEKKEDILKLLTETASRIELEFGQDAYLYNKAERTVRTSFLYWKKKMELGEDVTYSEVGDSGIGFLIVRHILDSFPEREWIYEEFNSLKKYLE